MLYFVSQNFAIFYGNVFTTLFEHVLLVMDLCGLQSTQRSYFVILRILFKHLGSWCWCLIVWFFSAVIMIGIICWNSTYRFLNHICCVNIVFSFLQRTERLTLNWSWSLFYFLLSLACRRFQDWFTIDFVLKDIFPTYSFEMIFHHHPSQKLLKGRRNSINLRIKCKILFFKQINQPSNWSLLERTKSVKHLINNYSQTPNICFDCIYFSFKNLGSHVDWWTQHSLSQISLALETFAKSKISNFNNTIIH